MTDESKVAIGAAAVIGALILFSQRPQPIPAMAAGQAAACG